MTCRIWDIENKIYDYPACLGAVGCWFNIINDNKDKFVIEEYTGYKDPRNKPIYVGDILLVGEKYYQVRFGEYYGYMGSRHKGFFISSFVCRHQKLLQWPIPSIGSSVFAIVGNIHEDKELVSPVDKCKH